MLSFHKVMVRRISTFETGIIVQLTGKQKRMLRALGHHLQPVVRVGKNGVEENQYAAIRGALLDHELIKIKLEKQAPVDRETMIERVVEHTGAQCVQMIGRTALIFAPHPEDPKIILPGTGK